MNDIKRKTLAQQKEFRMNNPELLKQKRKDEYDRNKHKYVERNKQYREEHKDMLKEYSKIYREIHKDRLAKYEKEKIHMLSLQ